MSAVTGLRVLVKLKTRRLEQQEEAVKQRHARLQDQLRELAAHQAEEANCREIEAAQFARLAETTRKGGFRGGEVVLLQHLANEASERTSAAAARLQQARQQVTLAESELSCAKAVRQRVEQQLQACQERLQATLDQRERTQEDQQDEESEEAAVARLLLQARKSGRHG